MTWVKLDDQFTDHPKIAQAGALAGWLYVCGLTYSARYLTDGFIPAAQVRRLADVDGADALAARLVEVGLWEPCASGYQVHDYLDYQPSGEQVRKERAASNTRVADWRNKKRQERNGQSNGVTYPLNTPPVVDTEGECNAECNAVVTPAPYPSPYPSPLDLDQPIENTTPHLSAGTPPERADNFTPWFDQFWQTYPGRPNPEHRPHGREPTRKALKAVPARDWDAVLVGVTHYAASRDVQRGYAIDPVRWVKERRWTEWQEAEPPMKETPHGETRDDPALGGTARTRSDAARLAHITTFLSTPEGDSSDGDDGSARTAAAAPGGGRVLRYRPSLGPGAGPHSRS